MTINNNHIVRVRQRTRNKLLGLDQNIVPTFSEVGIDRFQFNVSGRWSVVNGSNNDIDFYREQLTTPYPNCDWFTRPGARGAFIRYSTAPSRSQALGFVKVIVDGLRWNAAMRGPMRGGKIKINGHLNPTRTLAHRLAAWDTTTDFCGHLLHMRPDEFFAVSGGVDHGYGANPDNWIKDRERLHDALGDNPYDNFYPIYADKLLKFFAALVAPDLNSISFDGANIISVADNIRAEIDGNTLNVPQIETFIDRRHATAVQVMKGVASSILNGQENANATVYPVLTSMWVERQSNKIAVGTELARERRVLLYAKSTDRIRIEWKRLGSSDTSAVNGDTPSARILSIFDIDRQQFVARINWRSIAQTFKEENTPNLADFLFFLRSVATVASETNQNLADVFDRMISDGGWADDFADGQSALYRKLNRLGIMERQTLTSRGRPNRGRYSLAPRYRQLMEVIEVALTKNIDREEQS